MEHFNRGEHANVLAEWLRILKDDGELRLVLPNILWAAQKLVEGIQNKDVMNVLYGGQTSPYDFHPNGFTKQSLTELLHSFGFYIADYKEENYNMILTAKKAGVAEVSPE